MTRRVTGSLLLVVGLILAVVGVATALAVGPDDTVSSAPVRLHSSGVAVVVDDLGVGVAGVAVPRSAGTLTVALEGRGPAGVFVGTAPRTSVAKYLAGSPYDVVVEVGSDGTAATQAVPGTRAVKPPRSVTLWRSSAVGSRVPLDGRRVGAGALVVMNPDGSVGVDAALVATLHVPHARVAAAAVAVAGLVLAVLGAVLLVRARRRSRAGGLDVPGEAPGPGAPGASLLPVATPDAPDERGAVDEPPTAPVTVDGGAPAAGGLVVEGETADSVGAAPGGAGAATVTPAAADGTRTADAGTAFAPAATDGAPVRSGREPEPPTSETPVEAELDPVFAELVAAYGGDPVHDPAAGAVTDADPASSSDGARDAAGTPHDG